MLFARRRPPRKLHWPVHLFFPGFRKVGWLAAPRHRRVALHRRSLPSTIEKRLACSRLAGACRFFRSRKVAKRNRTGLVLFRARDCVKSANAASGAADAPIFSQTEATWPAYA